MGDIPKGRLKTVRMPLFSIAVLVLECCLKWFSNVLKIFNPWFSVKFSQKLTMPTWLFTAWLGQRVEHRTWSRFLVPVVATLYGWFMGIAHFIDSRWEEKRESLWWSNLPKTTTISQVERGLRLPEEIETIYRYIHVVEAFHLASLTCWLGQGIRSWEVSCFFETPKQVCCFEDL